MIFDDIQGMMVGKQKIRASILDCRTGQKGVGGFCTAQ